ncbi:MAG: type I restriction enzyme HsdR N-terminal domain-containing protein [Thermodesulfovibrionales bacterium]
MDIKLPDGHENREEAIEALLRQEIEAAQAELPGIRKFMRGYLLAERGYSADEIEADAVFRADFGGECVESSADLIVSLHGRKAILIRCFAAALASRERHCIACARLAHSPYQIPYAVVSDGRTATLLDTLTGKILGEGLAAIPSRQELERLMKKASFVRLPEEKAVKEQRILRAFDAIKCSFPTEE